MDFQNPLIRVLYFVLLSINLLQIQNNSERVSCTIPVSPRK